MENKNKTPLSVTCLETNYGFIYGAATVERCFSLKQGHVMIALRTPKAVLDIYVTKTGKVRIFDHNNKGIELRLAPQPCSQKSAKSDQGNISPIPDQSTGQIRH